MRIFRAVSLIGLGFAIAVQMTASADAEQKLALVIGNDRYEHIASLERAVGDAKAVEAALKRLGFSVTLATNVNFAMFAQTVAAFEEKIRPGDEVALHYSGHGIAIAGRNYLVPVDMIAPEPGQESLVAHLAVDAGALIDEIRGRDPKLVFAILDACRDNPLAGTGRSIGNTRGLARMEAQPGEFILFSAGPGEQALDRLGSDDLSETSVFTRVLLAHLETPGQSLQDLAKATQGEVRDLAAKANHEQFPDYFDRTVDKPVLKEAAVSPAENEGGPGASGGQRDMAVEAAPVAPPAAAQPLAEIEFWQSIKSSNNRDDFAAYLEEFPHGTFAPLARSRMAALQPAVPVKPKPPEPPPTPAQPDEVAWQRIASSTDAADFESFARFFPDSLHKAEADAKAKSLRAKTEPKTFVLEAPKPTPEPAPPAPDEVAWQRIASSTDAVDFESFARAFPDSVHKAEADAKAKSLGTKTELKTAALEPAPSPTLRQDSVEISAFITGPYLLNPRRNTSDFEELYADVVDYWGKANTKLSAVVSDKLSYFKKWPVHSYTIIANTLDIAQQGQTRRYKVSFSFDFSLSGGGKTVAGTGDTWLIVDMSSGHPLVVSENGRVTSRK